MIASVATLSYDHIPAIVIPVSERQNPLANPRVTIPPCESVTTSEYGKFAPHYSKLKRIATEPSLWSSDAERPSTSSLTWAQIILQRFAEINFPPTRVVASAEGGTAICFVENNKYADIESLNCGMILGVLSDRRNRPVVWEIEQSAGGIARAVDRIREFIDTP